MVVNRNKYLKQLVTGKSILHCGAMEGTDSRDINIKKDNWLHKHLSETAKSIIGIDLNAGEDILKCDLSNKNDCKKFAGEYDYIIFGEIIEHLFNVGLVLENLKMFKGELVITTPNNFSLRSYLYAVFNKEHVSPSHTCYYSVETLTYLLAQYGYKVTYQTYYAYLGRFGFIQKLFYKLFPRLADGIIIHAI